MIQLNNVTLVCVTSVNINRAINALRYSSMEINYFDKVLITHENISLEDINVIKTDKLDYVEYSRFIVYELHKYIKSEFALIIQDDGFVVHPHKWDDVFLKYDYIGAPFPIPSSNDLVSYRTPFGELVRVGNGGFSLRSKKLLSLASELNLEWKPYFGFYNEDGFFVVHNRHIYEQNGCIYAPINIAAKFSIENDIEETNGITPFGFHGKNNKYYNII